MRKRFAAAAGPRTARGASGLEKSQARQLNSLKKVLTLTLVCLHCHGDASGKPRYSDPYRPGNESLRERPRKLLTTGKETVMLSSSRRVQRCRVNRSCARKQQVPQCLVVMSYCSCQTLRLLSLPLWKLRPRPGTTGARATKVRREQNRPHG